MFSHYKSSFGLLAFISLLSAPLHSIEISGNMDDKAQPSQPQSNEDNLAKESKESKLASTLNGDLISWNFGEKLKTSVGIFDLPGSARVEDRRQNKDAKAKVSLIFNGDYIRRVVIYN